MTLNSKPRRRGEGRAGPTARRLTSMLAAGASAAALACSFATPAQAAKAAALVTDPASLVNPFIGTTNSADDFPGADAPFGMVQ